MPHPTIYALPGTRMGTLFGLSTVSGHRNARAGLYGPPILVDGRPKYLIAEAERRNGKTFAPEWIERVAALRPAKATEAKSPAELARRKVQPHRPVSAKLFAAAVAEAHAAGKEAGIAEILCQAAEPDTYHALASRLRTALDALPASEREIAREHIAGVLGVFWLPSPQIDPVDAEARRDAQWREWNRSRRY